MPEGSASPGSEYRCGAPFCLFMTVLIALWVGWIGYSLWHPDSRIIFRDSNLMGLPNLQYLGEAWQEKFIPWVNPRRGCGTPFLADPQTQALYPPAWVFARLPSATAFKLHQFAHLLLLGVGFGLLARFRGVTAAGSLCAGIVAVSAQCNITQLEWLPTLAGVAWVPWTLLSAMAGASGWWAFCLAMMIYSGYAYLWVMAPVIIGAGILLAPKSERRRFFLAALLLPAVTAPCWMGYFALTGDAKPHGMMGGQMQPVTGFEPWHLSFFLMPRGIAPYGFDHADGRVSFFRIETEVPWSLVCYFGVIPLILGLYAAFLPTRERASVLFMGAGGLAMAFGLGALAKISVSLNQAIHHPATFIQLFVWALLFAWPVGWQMLDDPAKIGAARTPARAWLWFGLGVTLAFAVHHHMSELALKDAASTYWYHSFNVGWLGWLIAGVTAFLAWESSRLRFAAASLLAGALIDVFLFLPMVIPTTDSKPQPPTITSGVEADSGRLRLQKEFVDSYLGTKFRNHRQRTAYVEWAPIVGFTNTFSRFGIHQFDDYNPPFIHETLTNWTARLDGATMTAEIELLRTMSGVRYIMSAIDMSAMGWKEIGSTTPPVGTWTARLYDAGPVPGAVVISKTDLALLDSGRLPAASGLIPVDFRWRGQKGMAGLPAGTTLPEEPVLFVPVTPWVGWRAMLDGMPVTPMARNGAFGLAVPLPAEARTFELDFRQPWTFHALVAAVIGVFGVWIGRRKNGFSS